MASRLPRVIGVLTLVLLFAANALAQQALRQPLINQPVMESQLTTLRGNTHPLARPQFDIGAAAPDLPLQRMLLVLKRSPQQGAALQKLLDDQQDKASPNYHKWLTPDEFGVQFGAADQDVQQVSGWLQSHGLQVNRITHGRTVIEFSGTEAQVEDAMHTSIHKFLVNGEEHWANTSNPQIPAALAPAVAGVWSLHDFRKKPRVHISPLTVRTKYTPGVRPDTTFNNGTLHALSPGDYATIYNINPVYANSVYGQNVTIGVVGRSNLFNGGQDIFNFEGIFDPLCCGGVQIVLDGPDPGDLGGGEEAEATLDATWSSAIAPAATVKFVVSASTNTTDGVDLSELFIIDNNLAPIMTESFGSCEGFATQPEAQALSKLAEQAAAQGITYLISSGDSGAAGCDDPNKAPATHTASVSVLSSPPFTVVVGGTQFNEGGNTSKYWSSTNNPNDKSSVLSYIPEVSWNESCASCQFPNLFATGGGVSKFFPKPTWQFGVPGIPNDGARDVPDVSLTAAIHDPYLLCLEGSCTPDAQGFISLALIGGTSASAPSFAGIMALVNQQHGPQGQANYVLYRLAAAQTPSQCNASSATTPPASTCVFNDVTSGNNSVPGVQGFAATAGYDLATGLGSVNVANLVNKWSTVGFTGTTTTLAPNSITATHGSPVTLNVSVAPNSGTAVPTGDVSLETSNGQGVAFLTLSAGAASSAVSNLPGGAYALTARYGGSTTLAPSPPSNSVNVNIGPENSTTTESVLTAYQNGNPIPFTTGTYGDFIYLRADVQGQSHQGFATGTVAFLDNGNAVSGGPFALNSEGNTSAIPGGTASLNAGSHSLTAHYNADSSFNSSTSQPATFSITKASTSTSVTASPNNIPQGSPTTITATLTSKAFGAYPTGTVTFSSGGTVLGNAQASGIVTQPTGVSASATFSTSSLPIGQSNVTAQYAGDTNYVGSGSKSVIVNVQSDFAITAANPSITIAKPGANGSDVLNIAAQTGYGNSSISFSSASCTGLPFGANCSFNPASITGSGSTTVTVSTTAPSAALQHWGLTTVGFVFAGVFLLGIPSRRFRAGAIFSVLLVAFAVAGTGCGGGGNSGGGSGNPGTPAGTFVVTVTATSSNSISHPVTFNLTIQ